MVDQKIKNILAKNGVCTIKNEVEASTRCLMYGQGIWYDMYYSCAYAIDSKIVIYLSIGGKTAAGYFKTDGQNYCVSMHVEDRERSYTKRALLGWTLNDVYENVLKFLEDISSYKSSQFEEEFKNCYSHLKAVRGTLFSQIEKEERLKEEEGKLNKQIEQDLQNSLLIKILSITQSKNDNCFCTESRNKFKKIASLILEEKPELVRLVK